MAVALGPVWKEQMTGIAAAELAALGVTPDWDVVNPLINSHIQEFGLDRLAVPIGTSKEAAGLAIQAGITNRESIGEIARRLVSVGATDQGYRSRLIARTEIVRSANMGRQISWKASGLPGLRKRWLSALGPTTRDSHARLHNTTVPLDGVFTFDASLSPGVAGTASVPGDTASAAHAANCQCTSTAFDPNHSRSIEYGSTEHVRLCKAFEDEVADWEKQAVPLISDFYKDIERDTLRILEVDPADLA